MKSARVEREPGLIALKDSMVVIVRMATEPERSGRLGPKSHGTMRTPFGQIPEMESMLELVEPRLSGNSSRW